MHSPNGPSLSLDGILRLAYEPPALHALPLLRRHHDDISTVTVVGAARPAVEASTYRECVSLFCLRLAAVFYSYFYPWANLLNKTSYWINMQEAHMLSIADPDGLPLYLRKSILNSCYHFFNVISTLVISSGEDLKAANQSKLTDPWPHSSSTSSPLRPYSDKLIHPSDPHYTPCPQHIRTCAQHNYDWVLGDWAAWSCTSETAG